MEFLLRLFDTSDFPARWTCGRWSLGHGWLHILSDLGIWSAYFTIPVVLGYFLARRNDLPFRSIFLLFAAFIVLCGTTHLMEAIIFWWPAYRLAGVLKLLTAVVSWITVFALIRVAPTVLAMRTPDELERDIVARKQAEAKLQDANEQLERRVKERTQELAEQAERLRTTLASIGDAVITTDTAGRITNMNAVAESLTGWANADAGGQPLDAVFNIVNETTRQPVENPAFRALQEGVIVGLANHTVLIGKDGTERPIDDSAAPIRCKLGEVVGCVLVFRDVSELHRHEAELRKRTAQLHFALGSTGVGMWLNPLPFGDLNWDARTKELFCVRPGEKLTIELLWSRLHPDDREPTRLAVEVALRDRTLYDVDHRVVNPDTGEVRWVRSAGRATYNEDGLATRFDGVSQDIHDRRKLEEELRQVAAALSEAHRRKDEFLATLAHELRNPLAPIRNGLQVMKLAGNNTEVVERSRRMMERQLEQMVRLVDDLMDVSRITRGKVELRKERVQLAAVVASAVETSGPLIEQMGHTLTVTQPELPVFVDADPTRLAQVFMNLLNNAAKYSEREGHIGLTVEQQGTDVVMTVKDTGIGIDADHLPRIFELFTQVDRSLEKAQGGLGIGLNLVKRLVEMHGGRVEARSDGPGRGSEFTVRLPVVVEAPVLKPVGEDVAAPKSSLRILIVDDNKDGADSLAMMLKILGNDTRTAYDGQEGIEQAEQYRPDVTLFDIGLPKLNGYEACRHIREQPWGQAVILIAVTGWGQDEDRRRSREAGFDHHMVKPVDPQVLMKLLAELNVTKR